MKNYYLEEAIENIDDQYAGSREECLETIKDYFKSNFTEEELLELLIRGQVHSVEDKRTKCYFNK